MVAREPERILLVDDSEDIRDLFRFVLEGAGYRVSVAVDGRQGLAAVREFRPDVIVTDVSMPVMDGFQFLVHLRSDFSPPLPPVIVCSGFDVTAEEALRLGAIRFVAKPVESAALVRIVQQALRGQPTEASDLQRERAVVAGARARAAAAAARLCATLKEQAPMFERAVPVFAQWIADYFGIAPAGVVLVDGRDVRVAGVSRDSFVPAGTRLSEKLLFATGVLAAGSSFVVTQNVDLLRGPYAEAFGLQFIVSVPLVFEDVPIGAVGLFDRAAHPFGAEDLLILEGIGRESSLALRYESPMLSNLGFVPPSSFDLALGSELAVLHRERGGLELLLVEMEPAAIRSELALEILRRGAPRLALCRREAGTLAIFKRDSSAVVARNAISESLSTLQATGAVRATGWVSVVDTGLEPVASEVVLRLVGLALDQSRSTGTGHIERMLIVTEPTRDASPIASAPAGA
jgi:CheY-like chemotaxis protein